MPLIYYLSLFSFLPQHEVSSSLRSDRSEENQNFMNSRGLDFHFDLRDVQL